MDDSSAQLITFGWWVAALIVMPVGVLSIAVWAGIIAVIAQVEAIVSSSIRVSSCGPHLRSSASLT